MAEWTLGSDVPPEGGKRASMEELLHRDHYTPMELAELADLPLSLIEQAAFAGRLKANIVDHDIVGIARADALAWMESRDR